MKYAILYSKAIFRHPLLLQKQHIRHFGTSKQAHTQQQQLSSSSTSTTTIESKDNFKKANKKDTIKVIFKRPDGTQMSVHGEYGKTLYDVVVENDLDIDGFGACEGTLCCTTCHFILDKKNFEKVGPPKDEELDMLDLALGLTETSRLGCQIKLKKEFGDELEVQIPEGILDTRE